MTAPVGYWQELAVDFVDALDQIEEFAGEAAFPLTCAQFAISEEVGRGLIGLHPDARPVKTEASA